MANYDLTKVQRVRVAIESTFGADLTGDLAGNFFDLRVCEHTTIKPETVVAEDMTIVQRRWQQNLNVHGPDRWSTTLKCYWTSIAQTLVASTEPTKRAQQKVLEALLGGYYSDDGTDVVASPSPTTTTFSVTAAGGLKLREGQIIFVKVGGGTVAYAALVTLISTDAITVWPALPSAPSTGDDVNNAQCIYIADDTSTKHLQVLVEHAVDRNNIYLGLGAQGDFTLDITRGNIATWSTSLKGAQYKHDDEFATPLGSGSSIASATFDDSSPFIAAEGLLHFGPANSTTRTLIRDGGFTINFARVQNEVPEYSGTEGLGQYHVGRSTPTCELTIPGPHETYMDAFHAGTLYGLLWQGGMTGGNNRAIALPTLEIASAPEPAEINGMVATKLMMRIHENNHSSSKTTEQQRSPIVLGHG